MLQVLGHGVGVTVRPPMLARCTVAVGAVGWVPGHRVCAWLRLAGCQGSGHTAHCTGSVRGCHPLGELAPNVNRGPLAFTFQTRGGVEAPQSRVFRIWKLGWHVFCYAAPNQGADLLRMPLDFLIFGNGPPRKIGPPEIFWGGFHILNQVGRPFACRHARSTVGRSTRSAMRQPQPRRPLAWVQLCRCGSSASKPLVNASCAVASSP